MGFQKKLILLASLMVASLPASTQRIDTLTRDSLTERFRHLVQQADKYYHSEDMVLKFQTLQEAGRYIDGVEDVELRLWYLSQLGQTLRNLGSKNESFRVLNQLINIKESTAPPIRSDARPWIYYGQVGSAYLYDGKLDSARHYFQEARKWARGSAGPWEAGSLNNLGILYLHKENARLAMTYLDSAEQIVRRDDIQSRNLAVSIRDNKVDLFLMEGQNDRAIQMLNANLDTLLAIGLENDAVRKKYVRYRLKRVDLFLQQGLAKEALLDLKDVDRSIRELGERIGREHEMRSAELREQIALVLNDPDEVLYATRALATLRDSTTKAQLAERAVIISGLTELSMSRQKAEMAALVNLAHAEKSAAESKARSRTVLAGLSGVLTISILTIIYILFRYRIRRKQHEKELVEFELEHKRKDVQHLAMGLGRKKERAEQVLAAADRIRKVGDERVEELVNELKEQVKAEHRVDEQREWIHREIETVNSAFYEKLKKSFPALVDTELELCGLIRSGLSNKEVAELRNISPKSARMARYRLKKKLGLLAAQDLRIELSKF